MATAQTRFLAKGTKIKMGDGASPEQFAAIKQAKDISGPAMSRGDVDLSDHDSTAKNIMAEPLYDPGTVDFTLNFDPADTTHAALLTAFQANTMHNFQIVLPTTVTPTKGWTFPAFVSKLAPKFPVAGALEYDCSLRVYGATTFGSIS